MSAKKESREGKKEEDPSGHHVVHDSMGGGPLGLGDPDSTYLRKVERDICIPVKIRDKTKAEKCPVELALFHECVKANSMWFAFKCRAENEMLRKCRERWYFDKDFIQECTSEYLAERAEYRRTGVKKKEKRKESIMNA